VQALLALHPLAVDPLVALLEDAPLGRGIGTGGHAPADLRVGVEVLVQRVVGLEAIAAGVPGAGVDLGDAGRGVEDIEGKADATELVVDLAALGDEAVVGRQGAAGVGAPLGVVDIGAVAGHRVHAQVDDVAHVAHGQRGGEGLGRGQDTGLGRVVAVEDLGGAVAGVGMRGVRDPLTQLHHQVEVPVGHGVQLLADLAPLLGIGDRVGIGHLLDQGAVQRRAQVLDAAGGDGHAQDEGGIDLRRGRCRDVRGLGLAQVGDEGGAARVAGGGGVVGEDLHVGAVVVLAHLDGRAEGIREGITEGVGELLGGEGIGEGAGRRCGVASQRRRGSGADRGGRHGGASRVVSNGAAS